MAPLLKGTLRKRGEGGGTRVGVGGRNKGLGNVGDDRRFKGGNPSRLSPGE